MKIWKVAILLPVALLITITQMAAQQPAPIANTVHSSNIKQEQYVSMASLPEQLHLNWFNISIEQIPETEISFYAPAAIVRHHDDATYYRIPVNSSITGNAGFQVKEYFPVAVKKHTKNTIGLKPHTIDYQKSTVRKAAGMRLHITGTIQEINGEHNNPGEVKPVDARPPSTPVSIVSIKAALKKDAVQINWEAREEQHLNLYEVERSTDGVNFQTIGLVFPWDNPEASNNYEFRDQHPPPGISYYRLRSINKDSSFTWSAIVPAGNAPRPVKHIGIMPNPVKGNIRAVFSGLPKATYTLELRSVSGTLQLKRTINIQQAEQLEILDPGFAPPGIYWLTLFDHSHQKTGSSRVVIR